MMCIKTDDVRVQAGGYVAHIGMELAGRYVLGERLGGGGMGEVWRGTDQLLDRLIAVKMMRDRAASSEQSARFIREARLAARLQHPGIAVVHDVGTDDGQLFIVMELLHGRDLAAVIGETPRGLATAHAVTLTIQAAEALQSAHEAHVIHRDLKPANLFLLSSGQLKICDFGLAKATDAASFSFTSPGQVMGTPSYMPPEQWLGRGIDERSDLYSLGCVLYELLTGGPPFTGGDWPTLMNQHLSAVPASPRTARPNIPQALDRLVMNLLAKNPADRPRDSSQVAVALRAINPAPPVGSDHPSAVSRQERPRLAEPGTQSIPVGTRGTPVNVGGSPQAVAVTPDGATAYVTLSGGAVIPVDLATRRTGSPIRVSKGAYDIAIAPAGGTAYVTHYSTASGVVTPINCITNMPGREFKVGYSLGRIAIAPDGTTAYVITGAGIVPIDLARGKTGRRVRLDKMKAHSIAITPDGRSAYVIAAINYTDYHIVFLDLATSKSRILETLCYAGQIKISPDGTFAYATTRNTVVPVSISAGTVGSPIQAPRELWGHCSLGQIAIAPDGPWAYVVDHGNSMLVPMRLDTGTWGAPVPIGGIKALAVAPDGATVYVISSDSTITPIRLHAV